jgi:small subunit ribosomal protein S1
VANIEEPEVQAVDRDGGQTTQPATQAEKTEPDEDLLAAYQAETLDAGEDLEAAYEAETAALGEDEAAVAPAQGGGEMADLAVADWDYQRPRRGEVRDGTILAIHEQEIIVDVGAKRDGVVPYADLQRLDPEALRKLAVGDSVPVYVLRPEDQEGNLLVSLFLARQSASWKRAQDLAESGEVWEAQVEGYNKGGLVVPIDDLRGFVPASQIPGFAMGMSPEERLSRLSKLVGETLHVKVIEINRRKRRLILSAQAGQKQWRQRQRERLLEELREGEVRKGIVSSLATFGAFVDLGGADGLVHLSELSWRRVRHPKEVVKVGQEVEVFILRLDEDRNRIALSLKRLEPEPWAMVEDRYELGQLVEGVVTNVVDFGAFAEIDEGIEGLIHVSELADAPISHPKEVVKKGDLLLLRIIRIDARRKRLGLSLKRVLEAEWAEWAARLVPPAPQEDAQADSPEARPDFQGQAGEEEMDIPAALEVGEEEMDIPAALEVGEEEMDIPAALEVGEERDMPATTEDEADVQDAGADMPAVEAEADADGLQETDEQPEFAAV